ncbi:MAG: retention module-containing protein, partial [Cellvibrionaceae bacterium]|nr:retention module-containing protein [Cellvibrionaceae bacterium]
MSNIANKDAAITTQSSQQEEKLIAQVSAIKGQVYKQLADHKQALKIGDKIAIESQLMTSDESAVAVRYQNGGGAILGSKQNVNLARLGQIGEAPQGEQDVELDFEALERAIESGSDLNELLPAAAAGGTASANSSAGTAGIRFIFTAEQVLPSAGFETNNFEPSQLSQLDELTPSNQAPVAEDEIFSASEDTIVSGNLLANDSDVNNDPLSLIGFELAGDSTLYQAGETAQIPGVGQITLNSDGSFEFIPNQNYNGPVPNISYTISDGSLTDTAQLIISDIQAINDAPIAIDDEVGLPEDGSILISVLQNDIDPDGDGIEIVSVGQAENGTVTIDPETGSPIYTANENYVGPDSFTYTITDPDGLQSTAVVRITVGPNQNDSPIAIDDQRSTAEDTPISISVLSNDSDPDNDPLSVQGFSQGANGSVSLDPSTGEIIYTPNLNFVGSDSFSYTITDPSGATDTAIVTITVGPNINDQPIAIDDSITTPEDSAVTISVRDNDSDPENDPLTVTAVTQGSNGSVSIDPVSGNPIYTPNLNFVGIDSFTYTITDPSGASSTATVTVTVGTNVNDTPIAVDDSNSIDEDGTLTISAADGLLNNDSDPDIGDSISVIGLNGQNNNTGVAIAGSNGGLFVINPDGSYSFNSNGEFNQLAAGETTTTSISYTISDLSGETASAVLTITITGSNDSPSLSASITDQNNLDSDNNISLDISGSFTDIDGDNLTFSATGLPAGLSISAAGVITGTIDNSASQFGTAPNLGAHSVTITAQDPDGQTVSDTFLWQVNNPAPTATDDSNSTQEDTAVNGNVSTNDTDPDGDNLSYSVVNNPSNGTVVLNNDGTYSYTPNADFNGTDSFTYQVNDGEGGTDQATVVITVTPVNDAPVVDSKIGDQNNNDADGGINLDISGNFADIDGDNLTFSATGLPAGLSISAAGVITGTIDNSASQFGTAPNLGAHTVTITAQDPDGQTVSDTFIWQVNNPAPSATDDSNSTQEDTAVNGNVASNDNDPDGDNLSYSLVNNPSNGTVVLNSDGSYSYTPNADFNRTDSFTYQVDDSEGGTDQATVVITVTPVNDAPVVDSEIDDQTNNDADSAINLDISGNFADIDGDNLTFSATGLPAGLSISAAGVITGTIDNSASQFGTAPNLGAHTVTITAQDPDGQTVSDTFIWQVTNPAPSATDDSNSTQEDTAVNGNVASNDSDPDGDDLSYSILTSTSNGTLVFNNDGSYSYTPDADFNGSDSFTYEINDGEGGTDQATVLITVTPVNDAPIANDDSAITGQGQAVTINVVTNDTDVDSANLFVSHINGSAISEGQSIAIAGQGSVKLESGQLVFTPNANFMGEVNFDYTVSDGNLNDNASVVINVIAVDIKDDSGNDDVISSIDDLTQTMISGQIPSGGNITSLSIDSSNGGSLNVPLASITINPDGTFSALIDTSSLNDGDLTISLSASDSNGASASSSDQILKDTVTTVSIDPITINENGPSTITGSGEAGATIVISANGVVLGNTTVGGNGSWTFNTPAVLGTNINLISANATDVYGNTNNAERNLPRLVIDDENGAQDGHVTVDEAALADGSDPSLTTESATGEFTLTVAPDSLNKITVGGTDILSATLNTVSSTNPASHITINTPHGRIVISNFDQATGVVSYRFDLLDAQDHGNSDALNDPIVIEVHDDNGDVRSGTLNVNILDDQASASADGNASVEEGGNVVAHNSSGQSNLIANDIEGADEARIYDFEYLDENGVAQTANVTAGSSTTVQTQFGSLQVFSDGRWNFTSNTVNHSTDGLTESESFSYRLIDGDGDISSSSADKTIIISDTAPSFGATISGTVNEAGLSSGTNPAGVPTSVSGSLNLTTAADAVDTQFDSQIISSLEALNLQSGGQDLSYSLSANGHTLTASVNGQTVFTVQLNNTDSNSASYEFILSKAIDHDSSSTPISIDFALSVEDADGDSDNNTLSIVINDDIQLESINHTINEDSGTQIYNTNADATQANTSITINPSFGTASINADGKLVYTPNQHYSGTDTLTYVTQEPGGISNTVTVTFTVNPRADRPNLSRDVATSFSDEDSIVALGFGLPQLVDTVDQNGNAANSGDNPERLGEILLRSIPAGTKILDGSNGNLELLSSTGADIKIAIVDGSGDLQPYMRSDISGSDILFLTEAQFEQLALLPPAHSGT